MFGVLRSHPRLVKIKPAAFGLALTLGLMVPAHSAAPAKDGDRGKIIGQPVALVVQPAAVQLAGPHGMQQLIVTGRYSDGNVRDLTALCDVTVETPGVVELEESLFLQPKKNGATALTIKAGGQTVRVP